MYKRIVSAFLCICLIIGSAGCKKQPAPMSEQLSSVYAKYQFSSTISTVNLDSGGYYTTEKPSQILNQPSSVVVDYIFANKRVSDTAKLNITYVEYNNELDTKNSFERLQSEFKDKLTASGAGFYDENYVIGFFVPQLGNHDNFCVYSLLYRIGTKIVYVYEDGPVSYIDQNQDMVNEICKTVGFDLSENYTTARKSLDK